MSPKIKQFDWLEFKPSDLIGAIKILMAPNFSIQGFPRLFFTSRAHETTYMHAVKRENTKIHYKTT